MYSLSFTDAGVLVQFLTDEQTGDGFFQFTVQRGSGKGDFLSNIHVGLMMTLSVQSGQRGDWKQAAVAIGICDIEGQGAKLATVEGVMHEAEMQLTHMGMLEGAQRASIVDIEDALNDLAALKLVLNTRFCD